MAPGTSPSSPAGSFRNTLAGETPYASFQKVTLTLGAPIPSLSPAGLAAAAALVLLAAGYALRRQFYAARLRRPRRGAPHDGQEQRNGECG